MKTKMMLGIWNTIRYYKVLFALFLFGGIVLAGTGTSTAQTNITCVMQSVCKILDSLVPIIAFTLFVIAGAMYGLGNFFGAETRSKASGYAMTAVVGAIIMLVIYLLGPVIITSLYGTGTTGITSSRCEFGATCPV